MNKSPRRATLQGEMCCALRMALRKGGQGEEKHTQATRDSRCQGKVKDPVDRGNSTKSNDFPGLSKRTCCRERATCNNGTGGSWGSAGVASAATSLLRHCRGPFAGLQCRRPQSDIWDTPQLKTATRICPQRSQEHDDKPRRKQVRVWNLCCPVLRMESASLQSDKAATDPVSCV